LQYDLSDMINHFSFKLKEEIDWEIDFSFDPIT